MSKPKKPPWVEASEKRHRHTRGWALVTKRGVPLQFETEKWVLMPTDERLDERIVRAWLVTEEKPHA